MKHTTLFFSTLLIAILCIACGESVYKDIKGKYTVVQEQIYFVKDNVITQTFEPEEVAIEDAYIYDFSKAGKVFISNVADGFNWEFDLTKDNSNLYLSNVNGDAEDDELSYSWDGEKLILTRNTEDADPDDDNSSIIVRSVYILEMMK